MNPKITDSITITTLPKHSVRRKLKRSTIHPKERDEEGIAKEPIGHYTPKEGRDTIIRKESNHELLIASKRSTQSCVKPLLDDITNFLND